MVTPEQKAEIARRNGAKSRGPVTAAGKDISSRNALKHGLRSESMFVLRNENPANWDRILAICTAAFHPATDYECELVEEIAAARWRMRRAWTIETSLFDLEMDQQDKTLREKFAVFDEGTRLASAFKGLADDTRSLALLSRYEARLRRNLEHAVANLAAHRNEKQPNEPTPDTPLEGVQP